MSYNSLYSEKNLVYDSEKSYRSQLFVSVCSCLCHQLEGKVVFISGKPQESTGFML